MLLNLNSSFRSIIKKFEEKKLKVTGINDYGDRLIVVLQPPTSPKSKDITVVDCTDHPLQPEEPSFAETKQPKKIKKKQRKDKKGRLIRDDGMVLCRFCGRACTSRGCTRHENNCNQRPFDFGKNKT